VVQGDTVVVVVHVQDIVAGMGRTLVALGQTSVVDMLVDVGTVLVLDVHACETSLWYLHGMDIYLLEGEILAL
jgi:hypothetical protein